MKVICAPDSFKESLSAVAAARAIAAGVRCAAPGAEIDQCPVGDGGEGTLESLLQSVAGQYASAISSDVFGQRIETQFGLLDSGRTAFIESAAAIGIAARPAAARDVMRSSSFGVGQLIISALAHKPEKIIIGVGGSATNDCGCGMAQALGIRFFDRANHLIAEPFPASRLLDIQRIDSSRRTTRLDNTQVIVASDVDNPLAGAKGAARIYGPQKGATEAQVAILDNGLRHVAELLRRDLSIDIESIPGAGAAGGLGGGLVAFAGAEIASGIDVVLKAVGFSERLKNADLCLTGEGCLDAQSLSGKACVGVARISSAHGVPTIALVGKTGPGAALALAEGITGYFVIGEGLNTEESIRRAALLLTDAADNVTRRYLGK